MTRPTTITAPCLGCAQPLAYELICEGGAPEIAPPLGATAWRDGHLCGSCAGSVATLLAEIARGAPKPVTQAKRWLVLYTRIPTNYNDQQKLTVSASTMDDARKVARDRLGDSGKQFCTYHIERITEIEEASI